MADGRHLEKSKKNGHISSTVWPIWTQFGTVTHVGPLNPTSS